MYGVDSRSAGHYFKSLEQKGCIIRKGISLKGARTNICVHARFVAEDKSIDMSKAVQDESRQYYNVNINNEAFSLVQLRDAHVDMIKDAPGQAILSKDVLEALVSKMPCIERLSNIPLGFQS